MKSIVIYGVGTVRANASILKNSARVHLADALLKSYSKFVEMVNKSFRVSGKSVPQHLRYTRYPGRAPTSFQHVPFTKGWIIKSIPLPMQDILKLEVTNISQHAAVVEKGGSGIITPRSGRGSRGFLRFKYYTGSTETGWITSKSGVSMQKGKGTVKSTLNSYKVRFKEDMKRALNSALRLLK